MPIYTEENPNEDNLALVRSTPSSTVVHFGSGDLQIATAKRRFPYEDEIVLYQHSEVILPLGTRCPELIGPGDGDLVLRFDTPEAVSVLIDSLSVVRQRMTEARSEPTTTATTTEAP